MIPPAEHLRIGPLMLLLAAALLAGCSEADTERRGRETFEKVQESMPNRVAVALAQKATPEDVTAAQKSLTALKEYMGEINGKLDMVTINAIQSFQRSQGLEDDGLLDEKTKKLLAEAAG
jgi:peptidoglycan hydrolase-like protein with peptidoglycan-binding domain